MQAEKFASILFLWQMVLMTTDKVTINETAVGTFVKITICSVSKEAIEATIEHYLKTYPYAGYMTWFSEIAYDPTHGFCVFGDRLASCD